MIRQVILDRASRKKDKSVSLHFVTDLEQSTEQFMEIDSLIDKRGLIYFSVKGDLTKEEIEAIDEVDLEIEGKTKAQRLRNVLYVKHSQTETELSFKDFYSKEMEKIIEHYKSKLSEL